MERLAVAEAEYRKLLRGEFDNFIDCRFVNKEGIPTETAKIISGAYLEAIKGELRKPAEEEGKISVKMKRDRFRAARGGKAVMLDIHCSNCDTKVLWYQKDGTGNLLRCYLNRIFAPEELEKLQRDQSVKEPKDMPNLTCPSCLTVLGTPMQYSDGRLAFRLRPGQIYKKRSHDTGR